jgi:hypothetical protein
MNFKNICVLFDVLFLRLAKGEHETHQDKVTGVPIELRTQRLPSTCVEQHSYIIYPSICGSTVLYWALTAFSVS